MGRGGTREKKRERGRGTVRGEERLLIRERETMRVGEKDADGTREESRGEEVAPAWKCSVRARPCGLVRAEHRRQPGGNVHCRSRNANIEDG